MPNETSSPSLMIEFTNEVLHHNVKRLGLNLGLHNRYESAQLLKNLIVNPGFESAEFSTIFLAELTANSRRVQADNWMTQWNVDALNIGQPVGFWQGAEYEVIHGRAKGRFGTITRFTHENGRYTFYLNNDGIWPGKEDVFVLRHKLSGIGIHDGPFLAADPTQRRPASPGTQSMRLTPPSPIWKWSWEYAVDSYGRDGDMTAGKLLIMEGEWRLEFWAKAKNTNTSLEIVIDRGDVTFFSKTITLSAQWQQYNFPFTVPSGQDSLQQPIKSHVALRMRAIQGEVWLDDAALYRDKQTNPTVFTDLVVQRLREYQPGVLRNWGEQLGTTLDNQLAPSFGRKTSGFSPRQRLANQFHYSLHEFLQLAQLIGCEPWYVIPPTWRAGEAQNLIAYLSAPAEAHPYGQRRAQLGQERPWTEVFNKIHLEWGNEMWGWNLNDDPFIGATVRGGLRLGRIAKMRLGQMKQSPYYARAQSKLNFIVGGQAGYPERQEEIARECDELDVIAIAPYFGELTHYGTVEEKLGPLFGRAIQDVNSGNVKKSVDLARRVNPQNELAIYELNFHTTEGKLPIQIRNNFVSSITSGIALPLYMLSYMKELGIMNQAAFTMVHYSFPIKNHSGQREYVRLWGMLRDLEATKRKRPTWLGIELVNRAIRGKMMKVKVDGQIPHWVQRPINHIERQLKVDYLQAFAFQQKQDYAIVLFNLHRTDSLDVVVRLPEMPLAKASWDILSADSLEADNELSERVTIETRTLNDFRQNYPLTLAPCSLHVLQGKSLKLFLPIVTTD